MKCFYLIGIFLLQISSAVAQQEYFTPEVKAEGLEFYKKEIYRGCSKVKAKQDPVSAEEMNRLTFKAVEIVEKTFATAFEENPKVKKAFRDDLGALARDKVCQSEGNHCRTRMLALSLYYIQRFRPDLPHCKGYVKTPPMQNGYQEHCEAELKYRKASLEGVHGTQYGMQSVGGYKKNLLDLKNSVVLDLFGIILQKGIDKLHICEPGKSKVLNKYVLSIEDAGDHYENLDPNYDIRTNLPSACVEQKTVLLKEFLPTDFDAGRTTVGADEALPLKEKVLSVVRAADLIVTDVSVTVSASKTPFYKTVNGKKVLDPESNQRNLALARQRSSFVEKALLEIRDSSIRYANIIFSSKAQLGGPDFTPTDLNERFVTRMTPGYLERIEALYKKNQKLYEEQALKSRATDLLNEKEFMNLYQAKFKPFHGFRLEIKGYKKDEMKCLDKRGDSKKGPKKTSNQ